MDDVDILKATFAEYHRATLHPGPEFGTAAWAQLDADDPRRGAAITRAAFAWFAQEHGIGSAPTVTQDDRVQASHGVSAAYVEQREERRRERLRTPRGAVPFTYPPARRAS